MPLLVIAHGGPAGVFTQSFIGMPGPYPMPAFGTRGYAVLRRNVRRHYLACVIPQERTPGLRWRLTSLHSILGDARLADLNTGLQQLAVNV